MRTASHPGPTSPNGATTRANNTRSGTPRFTPSGRYNVNKPAAHDSVEQPIAPIATAGEHHLDEICSPNLLSAPRNRIKANLTPNPLAGIEKILNEIGVVERRRS